MDISFPKFKLEQKYKMKKLLYALGIKNIFSRTADLSHLTDQEYVTVSQVSLVNYLLRVIQTSRHTSRIGPHLPSIQKLHALNSMDLTVSLRCVEVRGGQFSHVLNTFLSLPIMGEKPCLRKNIAWEGWGLQLNKNCKQEKHCELQLNSRVRKETQRGKPSYTVQG